MSEGDFKDRTELVFSELHREWTRVHIQNLQQGVFQPDREMQSSQQERLNSGRDCQ